ncbi:chromosomal replication initiation protein DnaA [Aerococcus urinaehominis]|uniref:Chromosomal replication initiator protein DnaA n=1 Tax=Aerococcus urinaehominis TaxID=128944 RepID=A0A120IAW1_9LACT|nr:chromosomal replication initiator protein DnaA [Aerococcus urinaehominis]AMB99339.1 chromosomal replication initiation protein DnaA [Aerococcus urinaehominis]SDM58681.1 chromosomal replication initiator protein [Aerococcus urinaehominis]
MNQVNSLWNYIYNYFADPEILSGPSFDTWIKDLKPIKLENNTLYLEAATAMQQKHVSSIYGSQIQQVAYQYLNQTIDLVVQLKGDQSVQPANQIQATKTEEVNSRYKSSPLIPKYTFENFIVGEGNKMAHAAALAVAESPGSDYNPLFFYGGVGLGKTHLMQAIGHEVLRNNPNAKVKYVSSETFTNEFIEAIRTNTTNEFHREYRSVDLLLVDDIQFIGDKQSTQEEFFHTFNDLYNNGKHIVLTSDRDASQIPKLEDRLVSRFKQGLSTDITPPDLETRIAILRDKAETNGIEIPDDTLTYIAGQIDTNVRELEGALTRVQAFALMNKEQVMTPSVAAQALRGYKDDSKSNMPTISDIQETVADYFNITVEDLKGKKRVKHIVEPRQIAMYLARKVTDMSLPKIGQEFGGKDHSTVIHAYEKIEKAVDQGGDIAKNVDSIQKLLKA